MSRIQLERLLKIDELIRNPERQTASTLAEAVEVSERTVRDDLAFMRDRPQLIRAIAAIKAAGATPVELDDHIACAPGRIAVSTMHLAKGLEWW